MSQQLRRNAVNPTSLSVCGALFVFAVVAFFNPLPFESPVAAPNAVPDWVTDTTPVRQPQMHPVYRTGVFKYRCNECHKLFPPRAEDTVRTVVQHEEVVLKHGLNTWCLSCHHKSNRDAFVGQRGEEIPWNKPQLLCAKCHGPVYRDWQHGSHGRTNGYWDETRGDRRRRKCIECHDPHQPPFPPMHPAPGPHTLRMEPRQREKHGETHNPLHLSAAASAMEEAP